MPPQPSGAVPQLLVPHAVVTGTHPQMLSVHASCGFGQVPQLIVPPQPSGMVPQF
jgi:hypothetical protein